MDFRKKLEREIEKQQQRIAALRGEITQAETYLRAQMDMLKMIPKGEEIAADSTLRPGGDPAKVRDILKSAKQPMHITQLLEKLGKPVNSQTRATLVGTLGTYVRKGMIFTRTAPNTFGLSEFEEIIEDVEHLDLDDLPVDFGSSSGDSQPTK